MTVLPCSQRPEGFATTPEAAKGTAQGPPVPPLVWLDTPRFVVGVTGSMELSSAERKFVESVIRLVLDWIAPPAPPQTGERKDKDKDKEEKEKDDALARSVKTILGKPLDLDRSSLMLLSSLAPGADQITAKVFARGRNGDHAPAIRCPLPFPVAHYALATTFKNAQVGEKAVTIISSLKLEQHCFTVLRPDDLNKGVDELNETYKRERAGDQHRVLRNYRYRAAGEYIATNCDLLIAVCSKKKVLHALCGCDPTDDGTRSLPADARPGAHEIVRVRLQGATPGVLANHPALTWSDAGPVLLIDLDCAPDTTATTRRDPCITWLAPYDTLPDRSPAASSSGGTLTPNLRATSDRQWLRGELLSLRKYAKQIADLNAMPMMSLKQPDASHALLPVGPPPQFQPKDDHPLFPRPKEIGNWIKGVPSWFNTELTAIYEWFNPRKCEPPNETYVSKLDSLAVLRRRVANISREYDARVKSMTARFKWLALAVACFLGIVTCWQLDPTATDSSSSPAVAIVAALITAAAMYALHLLCKFKRTVEWQNDARALAEALRVQFYWTAAGIEESVAAHYLQQEQNELVWLRGAVNSVAIPAEGGCTEISCDELGLRLLKRIKNGWLSEQLEYFKRRVYEFEEAKHGESFVRNTALISGVLLTLYAIFSKLATLPSLDVAHLTQSDCLPLLAWLATCCLLHWFWRRVVHCAWHRPNVPGGSEVGDSAVSALYKLYRTRWFRICGTCVAGLSLAAALGWLTHSQWRSDDSPLGPLNLREFLVAQLLAIAAIWHWHASTKFYDENAKRYSALANLFRGAENRFETLLSGMTRCVEAAAKGKCTDGAGPSDFDRLLAETRHLLTTLGEEALNENSAWLTMHRDHPIQPPKPIG